MASEIILKEKFEQVVQKEFNTIFPIINAEPLINVHFADPDIIKIFLEYPYKKKKKKDTIISPNSKLDNIINTREASEIRPEDLRFLIGKSDKKHRIYQYLGTITWFWEVKINKDNNSLRAIVARIPQTGNSYINDFKIIELNYSKNKL